MSILIMLLGVLLLFFLIIKLKLNTFVSLLLVSIFVGLLLGIPWTKVPTVVEQGIGDQVGHLAIIFGLGAMLGQLISDSGAGFQIANTFTARFGRKYIELAVVLTSFIIGLAMFFEVGLVILLPIIYAIAVELDVAFLYLALPMAVALNVAHAFLPPHPSPVAVAGILHAPLGQVLLVGILCAIPVVLIAGPLYNHFLMKVYPQVYRKNVQIAVLGDIHQPHSNKDLPSFGISIITATLPLVLIIIATIAKYILPAHSLFSAIIQFIGNPDLAMVISLIFAVIALGIYRGTAMKKIGQSMENAIKQIAMMLLIIGGAGAFKQVLVTGGVANDISALFLHSSISPLVAAWLIPALLHFCLGSTTVAALTGAGLVAPLTAGTTVDPVLMVLAVGAGSTFDDHVNGAGFWMVKEYFGLSLKEALATWSVLTCVTSVIGLGVVLLVSLFV
ncbi:gluconate permease [Limosilactobacillus pontis]|uniref:Gluconate permease n=1 Tax=Limosilactobacillus pontis TaxID=35787 RepID=A0A2J6NP11_9LACO|nr:gluconate:H+ symporter [Limosilactobacillus pontis]PMB83062.1 gluconate permease [Limosilactobacillus pontis]